MRRKNYQISCEGFENVIVHTMKAALGWNRVIRVIEGIVRELAQEQNTVYKLVDTQSQQEDFEFVRGYRTWKEEKTGKLYKFEIIKL